MTNEAENISIRTGDSARHLTYSVFLICLGFFLYVARSLDMSRFFVARGNEYHFTILNTELLFPITVICVLLSLYFITLRNRAFGRKCSLALFGLALLSLLIWYQLYSRPAFFDLTGPTILICSAIVLVLAFFYIKVLPKLFDWTETRKGLFKLILLVSILIPVWSGIDIVRAFTQEIHNRNIYQKVISRMEDSKELSDRERVGLCLDLKGNPLQSYIKSDCIIDYIITQASQTELCSLLAQSEKTRCLQSRVNDRNTTKRAELPKVPAENR